jgi:hypothetical protein
MVGKPAQVSTTNKPLVPPQQTGPGEPQDLSPKAKASAPPTWDELVDVAIDLSAKQNKGVAKHVRSCQPEFKVCFDAISWINPKGFPSSVKVVRDMNDKIVVRELCTFNQPMDIRKCLNWDTGNSHRDMQDIKGDWKRIADE